MGARLFGNKLRCGGVLFICHLSRFFLIGEFFGSVVQIFFGNSRGLPFEILFPRSDKVVAFFDGVVYCGGGRILLME